MENKELKRKFPGELKGCENCFFTLRQCEMQTSCVPCKCELWNRYLETGREE